MSIASTLILHHKPWAKRGDPLSRREREVAVLLAEGLSNQEIGRRLGISAFTVTIHVRAINFKLGLSARRALGMAVRACLELRGEWPPAQEAHRDR